MKKKLCVIFSVPSHYRESIYRQIDKEYDCDWFFSDEDAGVKPLDLTSLKNVQVNHFKKVSNRLNRIEGIQKLLRDKKYDNYLILFGTVCISIWWFLLRAKLFYPHKNIYMWGHGWYGKEKRFERYIKRLMLKASTGVFVYGEYSKKIAQNYGCDISKIHCIHNSLNYDRQLALRKTLTPSLIFKDYFKNGNPVLIFIGRLTPVKKLDQIIDAVNILHQNGESYNVVIVGDGDEAEALKRKTHAYGLDENFWFFGACFDEKENAELIYNSDLCVSPGNVGLTAVHSMMFGTPVITHNNFPWQMPEFETICDGVTGTFFLQDNIEDLAKNISEWFRNNREKREVVRNACYKVIDDSWNPYFQINLIKSVIK